MAEPTIAPTSGRALASAAAVGAAATWLGTQALQYAGAGLPPLGPGSWLPLALLGAVTGWLALATHRDLRAEPGRLEASTAVTRLRLARAGVLVAALFAGGYGVLALVASAGLPAPAAWARLLHAVVAVVAGGGWVASGMALERACRIPPGDDEDVSAGTE